MKASGAVNRHRKQQAESRRLAESKALPRRLALLSPEKQKEAQEIMDLIYYGDLTDPALDVPLEELMPPSPLVEKEMRPRKKPS